MKWFLRLRDWVEGSHTPSREELWRERSTRLYKGEHCPCGEPATGVFQFQTPSRSANYYTCSKHVGVTRWIPDPNDPGLWF